MTLDQEDLEYIGQMIREIAAESQETLAGMTARQFLNIQQQLQELQQHLQEMQKTMEASFVELKIGLDFLRDRLKNVEAQADTNNQGVLTLEKSLKHVQHIQTETKKDFEYVEERIERLEAAA